MQWIWKDVVIWHYASDRRGGRVVRGRDNEIMMVLELTDSGDMQELLGHSTNTHTAISWIVQ